MMFVFAADAGHVTHACTEMRKRYLLCTESGLWVFGELILLLGGTISTVWPLSPGNWPGARISTSLWFLSCGTVPLGGFCLFRTPSLPALISFSPTLTTRARPAVPGHSLLGEGSLDPAPAEGGRAILEDLDILGEIKLLSLPRPVWLKSRGGRSWSWNGGGGGGWGGGGGVSSQQM